ncbi:DUF1961 family protein [Bacillus licheniformis]|nr:DUF1961 family protein [Bacillus licheniformis]
MKWDFYPVREPGLCMIFCSRRHEWRRFI